MNLIIDNNVLFSLMKPDSTNSRLFFPMKVGFLAPEFIKQEFKKYKKECLKKSGISELEFSKRKKEVFDKIKFIQFSQYKSMMKRAKEMMKDIDIDDSPYIALALKLNSPVWSNDFLLKNQNKVKVLSTEEIVELLF